MAEPSAQVADAPVVLSSQRHYFGFRVRGGIVDLLPRRCEARRCAERAVVLVDYAYVRQRDMRPTYVIEGLCGPHAQEFARDWGLANPTLASAASQDEPSDTTAPATVGSAQTAGAS